MLTFEQSSKLAKIHSCVSAKVPSGSGVRALRSYTWSLDRSVEQSCPLARAGIRRLHQNLVGTLLPDDDQDTWPDPVLVSRLFEWYTLVQLDERSWGQGSGKTFKSRCGGMVDTRHLKCRGRKPVPVQVRPAVRVSRNWTELSQYRHKEHPSVTRAKVVPGQWNWVASKAGTELCWKRGIYGGVDDRVGLISLFLLDIAGSNPALCSIFKKILIINPVYFWFSGQVVWSCTWSILLTRCRTVELKRLTQLRAKVQRHRGEAPNEVSGQNWRSEQSWL